MPRRIQILTALLGLSSVTIFVVSFFTIGVLNPEFDFTNDYVSKLGSQGQPYADYWNVLGFGAVGIVLATFGWFFGMCRNDRVLGTCLTVSGIGFALAATPTDFTDAQSALSKAHYVSICCALAGWCLGMARLLGDKATNDFARSTANYAVVLAILPMVCISGRISTEPIAHRIVLVVVFTWVILNSIQLFRISGASDVISQRSGVK